MAEPIPAGWAELLTREAPFFQRLSATEQERLLRLLMAFLDEKEIVGAGGLEVDEEMRLLVGASAVRLVLGLDLSHYDRLTEIVLYPQEVLVDPRSGDELLGLAHRHGAVVLSWPAVLRGLARPDDGLDTATHEFAHALDLADGAFDGAPSLRAGEHYRPWAAELGAHYERLQGGDRRLGKVLRDYGATDPAEFFAVATEAFFERPEALRRRAPGLYEELARFYGR